MAPMRFRTGCFPVHGPLRSRWPAAPWPSWS